MDGDRLAARVASWEARCARSRSRSTTMWDLVDAYPLMERCAPPCRRRSASTSPFSAVELLQLIVSLRRCSRCGGMHMCVSSFSWVSRNPDQPGDPLRFASVSHESSPLLVRVEGDRATPLVGATELGAGTPSAWLAAAEPAGGEQVLVVLVDRLLGHRERPRHGDLHRPAGVGAQVPRLIDIHGVAPVERADHQRGERLGPGAGGDRPGMIVMIPRARWRTDWSSSRGEPHRR